MNRRIEDNSLEVRIQRVMNLLQQLQNDEEEGDGEDDSSSNRDGGRQNNNNDNNNDDFISDNENEEENDNDENGNDAIVHPIVARLRAAGNEDGSLQGLGDDTDDDDDDDEEGEEDRDYVEIDNPYEFDDPDDDDDDDDSNNYMDDDSSAVSSVSTTWTQNDDDRDCSMHTCVCCACDSIDERVSMWPHSTTNLRRRIPTSINRRVQDHRPIEDGGENADTEEENDDDSVRLCLDSQFAYHPRNVHSLIHQFLQHPKIRRLAVKMGEGEPGSPHILELLQADPNREWKSVSFQGGIESNGLVDLCSSEFMSEVMDQLEYVESLNLIETTTDLGRLAPHLSRYPQLHTLRMEKPVNSLSKVLDLTHALERNSRLTRLSFSDCSFFGHGNDILQNHNSTLLDLVTGLSNVRQLVTLRLCRCNMEDTTFCYVVQALKTHPSLRHLHLGGNSCSTNRSIQAVTQLIASRRSKLVNLNLCALWYDYVAEDPHRHPDDEEEQTLDFDPIFTALAKNKKLEKLYLAENPISDDAITTLAQTLRVNTTLTSIDLRGIDMGFAVEKDLLQAVALGRRIKRLRISYCDPLSNFLPHLNWAGCQLLANPLEIPLAVWPHIFARVNHHTDDRIHDLFDIPAVLYQMLRCPNGESSIAPLLVHMAAGKPSAVPEDEEDDDNDPLEEEQQLNTCVRRKKRGASTVTPPTSRTTNSITKGAENGKKKRRVGTAAVANDSSVSNNISEPPPQRSSERCKTLRRPRWK